jgi:hypothetical protein
MYHKIIYNKIFFQSDFVISEIIKVSGEQFLQLTCHDRSGEKFQSLHMILLTEDSLTHFQSLHICMILLICLCS